MKSKAVKRMTTLILAILMTFTLFACGNKQNASQGGQESGETKYTEAVEVLKAVTAAYGEEELFSIYGGNQEDAVMDAPGKFDISKTEELDLTLGLPESQSSHIDDAASMIHMMNANTFTGAVYHLKDGTDMDTFVDEVKTNILARQWICGQPDTLIMINAGEGYVITAFGEAEIMETFKTNALSALSDAKVIAESPIA